MTRREKKKIESFCLSRFLSFFPVGLRGVSGVSGRSVNVIVFRDPFSFGAERRIVRRASCLYRDDPNKIATAFGRQDGGNSANSSTYVNLKDSTITDTRYFLNSISYS